MLPRRLFQLATFLLLAAFWVVPVRSQERPLGGLDEYVAKAMRDWRVPGLAVAVVKDDTVVLAKGYGVRKLGESKPVTAHTLFAIASCSKAFTAAALAMLVDDGKIKWDDPVSKYLPRFMIDDPYVSRELTVRDLLCHRSGLERHDWVWLGSATSRDQVLDRLHHAKPKWSLRSHYGYQNILYLAAGQIIPAVTGKSWDDFVRERIFVPLGMTASNTSVKALAGREDVATPHMTIEDKVEVVSYRDVDNIGPAGSINSNVHDLAQWLRFQLNEGTYEKKRLLTSGAVREMHTPQTVVRREGVTARLSPDAHLMAYGLGWTLRDYHGRLFLQHGGALRGMRSVAALVPEERLGVVVLTNLSPDLLQEAMALRIVAAYLGVPSHDWSTEFLAVQEGLEEERKAKEKKQEKERVPGTKPSLALDRYTGTYRSDLLGEVQVIQEEGHLVVRFGPDFTADLEHWHYDTFRAHSRIYREKHLVTFTVTNGARVGDIRVPDLEGLVARRVDERAEVVSLSDVELGKFVGVFVQDPPLLEMSIEMVGGKLKAMLPGQSITTLVPLSPARFKLDGMPGGWFVEFAVADGKVKEARLERGDQPEVKLLPRK